MNGAADYKMPVKQWYSACAAAYPPALSNTQDEPWKDDMRITGSVLQLYTATALNEMHDKARAQSLAIDARNRLIVISANGATPAIRHRAQTMIDCLIMRKPECLAAWKKANNTGVGQPASTP